MQINNRRDKNECADSKILRELTLFMVCLYGLNVHATRHMHAVSINKKELPFEDVQRIIGTISERTLFRYISDLRAIPCAPEISYESCSGLIYKPRETDANSEFSSDDPHLIRLNRLCTIAAAIPDINLPYSQALERNNFKAITDDNYHIGSAAKVREYCPFDIDKRTYQRDIKLVSGALRKYVEFAANSSWVYNTTEIRIIPGYD